MPGFIGWDNQVDAPDATLEMIGSGSELTSIENLRARQLGKVWRVEGATNGNPDDDYLPGVRVEFEVPRRVSLVAALAFSHVPWLAFANAPALVKLFSGDKGSYTLLATAYAGSLPYISGIYSSPPLIVWPFDQEYEEVSRVDFLWATDDGAQGNYDLGRLWISRSLIIPEGFDAGWGTHWTSDGTQQRSRSGAVYAQPAPRYRTMTFGHSSVPRDLVLPAPSWSVPPLSIQGLAADVGNTGEALIILRSSEPSDRQETAVYGSFPDGIGYDHVAANRFRVDFTHVEER